MPSPQLVAQLSGALSCVAWISGGSLAILLVSLAISAWALGARVSTLVRVGAAVRALFVPLVTSVSFAWTMRLAGAHLVVLTTLTWVLTSIFALWCAVLLGLNRVDPVRLWLGSQEAPENRRGANKLG